MWLYYWQCLISRYKYTCESLGKHTQRTDPVQGYLNHQTTGQTLASFSYTLDNVGNRTAKSGTTNENYFYDLIYRLVTVTSSTPEAFTYDPVGNRVTGPAAADIGYLYNAGNQATQDSKYQYSYDNNGNQTARVNPSDPTKNWTLTWDYENRLIRMDNATTQQSLTFKYDPMGRRIEKKATTVINEITTIATYSYLYDNDAIAVEVLTDNSGTIKTFYTHGPRIDEPVALERSGLYYYYHADGLGSIAAITDQSANVVQSYTYSSFGNVTPSTDFRNSFTYTGRERDKETGLYYYRARYYDPTEGRFISKDPIGYKGGINLYNYTQANPINYKDPTGLLRVPDLDAIRQYISCMVPCISFELGRQPYGPNDLVNDPITTLNNLGRAIAKCKEQCRPPCLTKEVDISIQMPSPQMARVSITAAGLLTVTIMIALAPVGL